MTRLVGVDVGGTKVAVAALEDGRLGETRLRPTELESPDALVDQLEEAIQEALPADAVGIGMPSVVDLAKGAARSSVNIPLEHVPLRKDPAQAARACRCTSTTTRPSPRSPRRTGPTRKSTSATW